MFLGTAVRAQTLPTGGTVALGAVSIAKPVGNTLNITQSSQNAIVNWQGFSIGGNSTVDIAQPDASAALLNRVTGGAASTIAGRLNANGQVYLINPNGIAITKSGVVDVGGAFVASTLGISDEDFKNGTLSFKGNGASAGVVNQGTITVGRGGYAALLGGSVNNAGLITVPLGKVGLGSGEAATLDVSGDGFLQVAVPTLVTGAGAGAGAGAAGAAALIQSSGTISVNGGSVVMSAATARAAARNAINLSGVIEARSIFGHDGAISLSGGEGGGVQVSGTLDVSGGAGVEVGAAGAGALDVSGLEGRGMSRRGATEFADGGTIVVTGQHVALSGAMLNASGGNGGRIDIGGDEHGGGALLTADTLSVDVNTVIEADGLGWGAHGTVGGGAGAGGTASPGLGAGATAGHGGSVVLWSNELTSFAGRISATGAPNGGTGGDAEVSSKNLLQYSGSVDLKAPDGVFGTLLLDPYNVTIETGSTTGGTFSSGTFTAPSSNSILSVTDLQNALANASVTVTTGGSGSPGSDAGNITVASPLTWSSGSTLTLTAYHSIAIDAGITITGAGGLTLTTNNGGSGGTLTFAQGAAVQFTGTYSSANDGGNTALDGTALGALTINGTAYTLLNSMMQIDGIDSTAASTAGYTHLGSGLAGNYALVASLNAAGTAYTDALVGTYSSASSTTEFTGTFEGLGNTISGLSLTKTTNSGNYAGLFGYVGTGGTVSDIGLVGGSISGGGDVGALAGANSGTVANSYSSAAISASGSAVGGLIGSNGPTGAGTLINSYATGSVLGNYAVGGLVGSNGCDPSCSGSAVITEAYATGAVGGNGVSNIGGLIGRNGGSGGNNVNYTYSTGYVANGSYPGGSIGYAFAPTHTYFDTTNSGQANGASDESNSTTGAAGVTALTTAQLQGTAALPNGITVTLTGFSGGVAGTSNGGTTGEYPYLSSFFPNGVQTISGIAYKGLNTSAPLVPVTTASTPVTVTVGGVLAGTVSTGATGYYYLALPPTTISGSGSNVLAYTTTNATTGAVNGDNFISATGSVSGLNIYGGASGSNTTSSLLYSTLGAISSTNSGPVYTAITGYSSTPGFVSTLPPLIVATGASFTFDQSLDLTSSLYLTTSAATAPITIAAPITLQGSNVLALSASGPLAVNANISVTGTGTVSLVYNTAAPTNFTFAPGASLQFTGTYSSANDSGNTALDGTATGALTINGTAYTLVNSMAELDAIDGTLATSGGGSVTTYGSGLAGPYALALPLTATGTTYTKALVGTDSSGTSSTQFTGTFEGLGNTVTGVAISSSGNYGGLFGYIGTGGVVRDLGLLGGGVTAVSYVGGVAGYSSGTIVQDYNTGTVSATSGPGGLVGWNYGNIYNSHATGNVTSTGTAANDYAGGFVGYSNTGTTITGSYATGSVSTSGNVSAGGFVGQNYGTITDSYATGAVADSGNGSNLGGFVGYNYNTINNSYATGSVRAGNNTAVGGFAGRNGAPPSYEGSTVTIENAYATGTVTAGTNNDAAGFIGDNYATVKYAFSTGAVIDTHTAGTQGGFVGYAETVGIIEYAYSTGAVPSSISNSADIGGFAPSVGAHGTTSNDYWDTLTSGNSTTSSVATGQTTAQLQGTATPTNGVTLTGFSGGVAGTSNGGTTGEYPYLTSFFPNGVQAVAGYAYQNAGTSSPVASTTAGAGSVSIASAGAVAGTVATGANGYYYLFLPAGTFAANANVVAFTQANGASGAQNAVSFAPVTGLSGVTALNVYGGWRLDQTGSTFNSLSALNSAYATAVGSTAPASYSLANREIDITGALSIDQALSVSGTLAMSSSAAVTETGSGALTAGSLLLTGTGGSYALGNANSVATLAASTGSVSFTDAGSLATGAVSGASAATTAGVTTSGAVSLISPGNITLTSGDGVSGQSPVIAATGAFINNAGAAAVTATSGSWLIYSSSPGADSFGSLNSNNGALFNATYSSLPPGSVTQSGNTYLFANQPSLTVTSVSDTKSYGVDDSVLLAGDYTVTATGIPGSGVFTINTATSGTPLVTSAGSNAYASVAGGPYPISVAQGALTSAAGYGFNFVDSGSLTVTPATITVAGATGVNKTYDTTTALPTGASGFTVSGIYAPDSSGITVSAANAAYAGANAGAQNIAVSGLTLSGTAAGNYTLSAAGVTGSGTIAPAVISLTGTRVYDAGLDAAASLFAGAGTVAGVDGQTLTLSGSGTLAAKNVGSETLASLGTLSLGNGTSGTIGLASNYTLVGGNDSVTVTPLGITVTGTGAAKIYDGTVNDSVTLASAGVLAGDVVSFSDTAATFADKNVGTAKTVTIAGIAVGGTDGGNYIVNNTSATTTADITPATITVAGATGVDKVYDATTALPAGASGFVTTGIDPGDAAGVVVSAANAAYASAAVGPEAVLVTGLSVSGSAAGNYVLSAGAVTGSGKITAASGGGSGGTGGGAGSGSGSGVESGSDTGNEVASMVVQAALHGVSDSLGAMPLVYSVDDLGPVSDVVDSLGSPGFDAAILCVKGHCDVVAAVGRDAPRVGR